MHTEHFMLRRTLARVFLLAAALLATPLLAQDCNTSGPVTLSSQAQVDSFQADYGTPTCTVMRDNLTISGADITDLSALGLTTVAIPAELIIDGNAGLASLDGLALTSVFWLEVSNNPVLTSIDGLATLTSVSGPVFIRNNPMLGNVGGLSGLTSLTGGALILEGNANLTDLGGLSGLTSTGGSLVIYNNPMLANLDALGNVTSVYGLTISGNTALTSISGLASLSSVSDQSINIRDNPVLASLDGLSGLSTVGGLVIDNNDLLTNLDPFSGITNVGNKTALAVMDNDLLTDITGLGNVQGVGFEVVITGNTSLSQCSILARLLDQVDCAQAKRLSPEKGND